MTKRKYKEGLDRKQEMLLPSRVEEYVTDDNPIRAIDAYVDSLDLAALGFLHTAGGLTPGQPAYPPGALLKLYLYGYLHCIRSSRRLEKETQRNLEVIWLMRGLRPSYKTIADFRKHSLRALKEVNKDFVQLCKELQLYGNELVGIDGSHFRGSVNKTNIYTEKRLTKALSHLEKQIEAYLEELERADTEEVEIEADDRSLEEKLKVLQERQRKHQERLEKLTESNETQLAEVDEDARLLRKSGQTVAGYNVQVAVEAKHNLLVACEVTNEGNDEKQLEPMAKEAQEVLGVESLEVVADAGYFNVVQIMACEEAGITPYVPEPNKTNQARLQGRFAREDFHYQVELDSYECPASQQLTHNSTFERNGKLMFTYASKASVCARCSLKTQCLPPKTPYRQVSRWEHEHIVEAHRVRMAEKGSDVMQQRAALVEHPFGTLKQWCGSTHFLLRGMEKVAAEMDLLMLCYNFKRVLSILGVDALRVYCLERAKNVMLKERFVSQKQVAEVFLSFFSRFSSGFLCQTSS